MSQLKQVSKIALHVKDKDNKVLYSNSNHR